MTRQAPSISATECKVGTKKKGNDGKMWIVVKVKGGVQRWKKLSPVNATKTSAVSHSPKEKPTNCEVGTIVETADGKKWVVLWYKNKETNRYRKTWRPYRLEMEARDPEIAFEKFAKSRQMLTLTAVKKLKPKTKLKLCVFLFDTEKAERFIFQFDRIEEVKGRSKKWFTHEIHGISNYLENLPISVLTNGEIRIVISSDISPVYLA